MSLRSIEIINVVDDRVSDDVRWLDSDLLFG